MNDGQLEPLRTGELGDIGAIAVGPDGSAYAVANGCGDPFCITPGSRLLARDATGTWTAIAGFQADTALNAVAVRSAGDVFFGGAGGLAWHYDGSQVVPLQTPGTSDAYAMRVCGSDVWMVGARGLAARFDGAQTFTNVGAGSATLRALSCTAANDIWASGDYALYRYDGSSWTSVDTGGVNNQPWRSIAVSSEEVWVAGESGFLLHGDRVSKTWDAVQEPAGIRLHGGYGLWQSGPGDLYLVGSQQRPRTAVLLRFDGAQWYALDPGTDHPLSSIDGAGPGDFFIAGTAGAILHAEKP